jgi:excisionase family DNA binding protein
MAIRRELEDLFTIREVAEKSRLSEKSIRRRIDKGEIAPVFRDGPQLIRIPASTYHKWWKTRAVGDA